MRTYPHHLTTDLPVLPVPSLDQSLERYRKSSAAVLDAAGEAQVNQAISDFAIGQGPTLQQTLEEYAQVTAEPGSSWIAEQWLEGYLQNRAPLLLTSSTLFQLSLPTVSTGIDRVVELLQRIGSIHILQAKRETPEERDADGQRMSMDAWAAFNGGIRTPYPEEDKWMRAGTGARYRTIGVLHLGRMWEVPLTGSEGKLLEASQLRAAIDYVLSQTQPAAQSFAGFSAMGSGVLEQGAPWHGHENREVYGRLLSMLFTVTLDPNAEDDIYTLRRWAFHPGNAWVYKPISYQVSLDTNMVTAHLERSIIDGGTLATAVQRMQQIEPNTVVTQHEDQVSPPTELLWDHPGYNVSGYQAQASGMRVERVFVRRGHARPFDISDDTIAQLILMIAQLLTYGRIQAHAQLGDMRHFRAGRTDVIRPVTVEAVSFVTRLVQDKATEAQFKAALAAQQEWLDAAKAGNAYDRHFFMLRYIGQELGGANAPLFTEHTDARHNFISTTTGNHNVILRAVAAPATDEGFNIHYTSLPTGLEYLFTWADGTDKAEEFYHNIQPAAELLYDFIAGLDPIH